MPLLLRLDVVAAGSVVLLLFSLSRVSLALCVCRATLLCGCRCSHDLDLDRRHSVRVIPRSRDSTRCYPRLHWRLSRHGPGVHEHILTETWLPA